MPHIANAVGASYNFLKHAFECNSKKENIYKTGSDSRRVTFLVDYLECGGTAGSLPK